METFIAYFITILSDIDFMLAMLIIVLVSACFLGRYIVITRRMVIATLGVIGLRILYVIITNLVIKLSNPDLYEYMETMSNYDMVSPDSPYYEGMLLYTTISSLVVNGGVFLYAFIFYLLANKEKKLLRAVESTIFLYVLYYYVATIVQYTYVYIRGGDFALFTDVFASVGGKEQWVYTIITVITNTVVYTLLFLIIYFGYFKKKRFYVVRMRDRVLFVVWLLIFSVFPAIPAGIEGTEDKLKMLCILFGSLMPVLGGLAPILLVMNAAEKSLKEKNEYQETYLSAELEYIERYKSAQESTRAFRHDIINNLSLTNMMLEEGKTEEASQHLKELLGNVKALSPSIITGDEMLDCIVAMKADKMKEMGIEFTADGVVDGGLHMKPMDVCSIFANAIDNAIEASSKLLVEKADSEDNSNKDSSKNANGEQDIASDKESSINSNEESGKTFDKESSINSNEETGITSDKESDKKSGEKPWVSLKIKRTEKFFIIKIENAAAQKVDVERLFMSAGYTSKKDKEHHGFGLRNIRNTVEDYNGLVKAESEDNSFGLSVMIPRQRND